MRANEVEDVDPNSGLQFDSYEMAWNTAMQGQGIALGMEPFVSRDIEAGLLVEPCPGRRVRTRGDWNLVYRKESANMEKLAKFRTWLLQEIDKDVIRKGGRCVSRSAHTECRQMTRPNIA